jgi:hypothetical protein
MELLILIIGIILAIAVYHSTNKWSNISLDRYIEENSEAAKVYVISDSEETINKVRDNFSSSKIEIEEEGGREVVIIDDKIWMKESSTKPIYMKNPTKSNYYIRKNF